MDHFTGDDIPVWLPAGECLASPRMHCEVLLNFETSSDLTILFQPLVVTVTQKLNSWTAFLFGQ